MKFKLVDKKQNKKLVNSVDSCDVRTRAVLGRGFFIALQVEITPEVHLNSLLRCLLVIFMYFASFYRRETHSRKIVNF